MSVEGEDVLLHEGKAARDGGVHASEVIPEAGVERELKTATEGGRVPLELVGKIVEPNDVAVDTVSVTHLQLGELLFDEADVVGVSEPGMEGVPEGKCSYLELLVRFSEFLEPPVDGGSFQVGAGIESLLPGGVVACLVAQEDHSALTLEEVKFLGFGTVETVRAADLNLLGVYTREGFGEGALDELHMLDVRIARAIGWAKGGGCCSEDGTNPPLGRLRGDLGGDGFSRGFTEVAFGVLVVAVVVLVVGGKVGHVDRRRGGGCEGGFWETKISWDFVLQVVGFLR